MRFIKPTALLLVGGVTLTLLGAGCSSTPATNTTTKNTNTGIGLATVPATGTPGTYKGKLETLVLTTTDFPAAYKPYENNSSTTAKYVKLSGADTSISQQYSPQQIVSHDRTFTESMTLITFNDTAGATKYYNTAASVGSIALASGDKQGTFSGLGNANYYQTTSYVNQYDSTFNSTTWSVWILKSNLVISAQIVTPATFTVDQVKTLLTTWEQKTATYKAATDIQLQQENSSAS